MQLSKVLELDKCPHCAIAKPTMSRNNEFDTSRHNGSNIRHWGIYICSTCGGVVTAYTYQGKSSVAEYFPSIQFGADLCHFSHKLIVFHLKIIVKYGGYCSQYAFIWIGLK